MEISSRPTLRQERSSHVPRLYSGTKRPNRILRQRAEMQRTLARMIVLAETAAEQSDELRDTGLAEDPDLYRDALHFRARMESIISQTEDALQVLNQMFGRYLPE